MRGAGDLADLGIPTQLALRCPQEPDLKTTYCSNLTMPSAIETLWILFRIHYLWGSRWKANSVKWFLNRTSHSFVFSWCHFWKFLNHLFAYHTRSYYIRDVTFIFQSRASRSPPLSGKGPEKKYHLLPTFRMAYSFDNIHTGVNAWP